MLERVLRQIIIVRLRATVICKTQEKNKSKENKSQSTRGRQSENGRDKMTNAEITRR